MKYQDTHVSGEELLLASDGELSENRQREVRRHLQSCWNCRKRMAELESTIGRFVDCYRSLDPKLPTENGSEARLRLRLANQSLPLASRGPLQWRWPVIAAGILLCAFVMGGLLRQKRPRRAAIEQMVSSLYATTIPNPNLTPGETVPSSRADVCQANAKPENAEVPEPLREAVFSEYQMRDAPRSAYEVDFLITPDLGGSSSIRNLWPQPYYSRAWNAHAKDALEARLHTLVCSGELDLSTAQHEIATNWVDAYKKYLRRDNPM